VKVNDHLIEISILFFCINFQIIHQPIHRNRQSKIQITHSLTLDIQSKVKYWSEIDLHQFEKKKALFSVRTNLFRHLFFSPINKILSAISQSQVE